MTDILTPDALLRNLSSLFIALMLLNAVLIGLVILLAFRVAQYKQRAEQMEEELNKKVREALLNED